MLNESMWFTLWVGTALKSTAALSLAWLIALALRRGSAAMRHLVWTASAAAVLALPFFSLSLPPLRISPPGALSPAVAAWFETTATTRVEAVPPAGLAPSGVASFQRPMRKPFDWRLLLMSLWAAGAAAGFAQMLAAYAALSRVRRFAGPSPDRRLAAEQASALGIPRAVDVIGAEDVSMPITCGILRPTIFMPRDSECWTEDRRRIVLLHELAHVRRGDVASNLVARLALVLNWWNPLAWIAWRESLKDRERATDDLVLHSGARPSEYAAHLLEVARGMQSAPGLAWAAVAMARRSRLEERLAAILDPRVNHKTVGRASALVAALLAVVIAAPFAALRAQDRASQPVLADIDATIRAAQAQKNYQMLEKPAETFEALRQYDNADKLLDAAVSIRAEVAGSRSAEYGVGLLKQAELEKLRNRPQEAETLCVKAAQVLGGRSEAAPALIYLGVRNMSAKNYPEALDLFQRARNLDAGLAGPAQMWMALVREREQNPADADTLFRSAVAVQDPESGDAATTLELYARFLKDQGHEEEAKSMSDRASGIRGTLGAQQAKSAAPRIGGSVIAPKLLSKVEPEYTEEARVAMYQGTAVLSVEVGADGIAHNIRITRGLGFGLDENAVTAVRQWRFQPATKDGAAVTVQANIEVNFRLL